jgi:hypothetical protein
MRPGVVRVGDPRFQDQLQVTLIQRNAEVHAFAA